ncbi:MAG: hypothetical protein IT349_14370 [Candidatus Eisenbacteria bacterium]|nr:hypothetical protein [Candidatus Eisenbacteria bacterium]
MQPSVESRFPWAGSQRSNRSFPMGAPSGLRVRGVRIARSAPIALFASITLSPRITLLASITLVAVMALFAAIALTPGWAEAGPAAVGACCKPDGSCVVTTPSECQAVGGDYLGDDTTCDPFPCDIPFGACCFADASCVVRMEPECDAASGLFLGDGTDCSPNPCPPAVGACCIDGNCLLLPRSDCGQASGLYFGDGVPCESNTCDAPYGCGDPVPRGVRGDEDAMLEGEAILTGVRGDGCGTLLFTADGTYENGIAWSYGGIRSPFYGAFAECYTGAAEVCTAVFDFTQIGLQFDTRMDVYLWDDAGGCPGNVLCLMAGVDPGPIAFWPTVSRHEIELAGCCVPETWWIGYWRDEIGGAAGWFSAIDVDGAASGCAKTCIAPGIGYPAGWQDASIVWGPMSAIGIGARVRPCDPVAVEQKSWGGVKALYR